MVGRAGLLLVLVACSNEMPRDNTQPMDDAPVAPMIDAPVAPPCTPLGPCEWLDEYQRRLVGALSGQDDISPGVKLAHRASIGERNAARQFLLDEFTALG